MERTPLTVIKTFSLNAFKAAINAANDKLQAKQYVNPKTGSTTRALFHQGVAVCFLAKDYDPTKDTQISLVRSEGGEPFYLANNPLATAESLGFEL